MIDREVAITCALKHAVDQPFQPLGRPIASVGMVFTRDGGRTWTVHLVPEEEVLDDGCVAVDTPGTWIVIVNGETGKANWVEGMF